MLALHATPAQMALLAVADLLPGVVVGPVAGAWADRLPRRALLIAADLLRAAVLIAVPVAAFAGFLSMELLYAVALAGGVLTAVFDVAYLAYLPSLVGEERIMEANSRVSGSAAVAEIGAFPVSGWLVQLFGGPIVLLLDAVSFLVSAASLAWIRRPEERRPAPPSGPAILVELREGLRGLLADPVLVSITLSGALVDLSFRVVGTVFLLYTAGELGFEPGVLGLIFATGGISSVLGAVAAGSIARRLGAGRAMVAALFMTAAALLLPPLARSRSITAALLLTGQQLLGDGAATVWEINQTTLLQRRAPPDLLGRLSGGVRSVSWAALLLGALLGGYLGQTVGLRGALLAGALGALLAACCLSLSPARSVR